MCDWWGGIGRTGTVVGCWLAEQGVAQGEEAIEKIAELRATWDDPTIYRDSPETETQRNIVRSWKKR
jgi:protein-tyrosine phosphatase